ncbi:AcrR family transcriptional regulator [Microbacterium natoriense]|uniref:AcrR family transcriptional regulator n=1 Tax=Microbacterium natoriense TaxID=284570 RepID=A0AAW8EUD7_9MICO|nr:TetR family transcriptional regulator [Microbacterium natoriense]MDQ0647040.1 AcrR family transcriptional regulator [Microbacterium natoriense]
MKTNAKTKSRPTRAEQKDRTREEIRRAALDLFETRGFHGTTIDDITALASVGRRTFFRYFLCKEAVLFDGGVLPHLGADMEPLLESGTPPVRALFMALENRSARTSRTPDEATLRRRKIRAELLHEPSVAEFYRLQVALVAQMVTDVVRQHPEHAAVPYLPELVGGLLQIMTIEHLESGETLNLSLDASPWREAVRALERSFDDKKA